MALVLCGVQARELDTTAPRAVLAAADREEGFTRAMASLDAGDPKAAAELLVELAESGEARAKFALALLYDLGAGVRIDHERASALYASAAEDGLASALHMLAWRNKVGLGGKDAGDAEQVQRLVERAGELPFGEPGVSTHWLSLRDGQPVPNFGRAYGWMLRAASEGDVVGMANLAQALYDGPWTTPNIVGHVTWLERAGEAGDGPSAERLWLYHRLGMFVQRDESREGHWLRRAAEAGVVAAQHALARRLERGEAGERRDGPAAARWYERAVAQGHVPSMVALGRMVRDGAGVPQNYRRACELFQAAADRGDADGLGDLGWMVEKGKGTPLDYAKARDLYRRALEMGNGWAGRALGDVLQNPELGPTPWSDVLAAYERGAELGSTGAMNGLGDLHYHGRHGTENREEAFMWYERAAREGNAWAQNRVGWMLRRADGIGRDDEEAVSWFRLAARQGNLTARANLGYHLTHGLGVARDAGAACEELLAAVLDGDDSWAAGTLVHLIKSASPEEAGVLRPLLASLLSEEPPRNRHVARLVLTALVDGPEGLRDLAAARAFIERRAGSGDIDAMADASMRSFTGHGMPYDLDVARTWARRVAERVPAWGRTLEAQIDLITGDSHARNAARDLLESLAASGDVRANQTLGYVLATGEGLPPDFERAWKCVEVLAGRGMPTARDALALRKSDPRRGLARCFGAAIESYPEPNVMAGLVAQRQSVQTHPDTVAMPVHTVPPIYPSLLKRAGVAGTAAVEVDVDADGRPVDVRCIEASHPLFAIAAETALRRWWFAPSRASGEPVASTVRQRLSFKSSEELSENTTQ